MVRVSLFYFSIKTSININHGYFCCIYTCRFDDTKDRYLCSERNAQGSNAKKMSLCDVLETNLSCVFYLVSISFTVVVIACSDSEIAIITSMVSLA